MKTKVFNDFNKHKMNDFLEKLYQKNVKYTISVMREADGQFIFVVRWQ